MVYGCHYMLNGIIRPKMGDERIQLNWFRRTDMVRGTGIQLHLDFQLQPKSGFKVRVILFQSPKDMDQLTDGDEEHDNSAQNPTAACPQGFFDLNGSVLTQFVENEDEIQAAMTNRYKELFQWQNKTFDHLNPDQMVHRMKIKAPSVATIYNRTLVFVNRRRTPRQFTFNRMVPLSTTWKYPPRIHDGIVDNSQHNTPDRKVYAMMLVTPIVGGVPDPGQPMHGFEEVERLTTDPLRPARSQSIGASVVSDRFKDPDEGEEPPSGPSGRTRSKTPTSSVKPEPATPGHDFASEVPKGAEEQFETMLLALGANRQQARREAQQRKEALMDDPDPSRETNEYGWAIEQTIMIRPTFTVYFKNMDKTNLGYRMKPFRRTYRR